jgi:uncharacterized protein (UPF0332 family)
MRDKDILDLLAKAKESVKASDSLLKDGFYDFSASRAYYATFYAAEAVLLTKDLSFSKHKAVIAAFGKEFVKSGLLPARLHAYLVGAFDLRQLGDYGPTGSLSKEKAERLIKQAREFLVVVEEYLRKEGYSL